MKPRNDVAVAGVVVGRFQVAELHTAHKELIESVRATHPRTIVVLGMAKVPGTRSNPLPFEAVSKMVLETYPDVDVVHITDTKSNEAWSRKLDEIVSDLLGPSQTAMLYGSRDSFIKFYSGKFPTQELIATTIVSGTEIRENLSRKARQSFDWRAGAIWQAYNQYRKVYPTVDMAIAREGKILFVKKPGELGWRFPGGFAEPDSESYEADAIREAKEETSLDCDTPQYIGSFKINDWRYNGSTDAIKTLFFFLNSESGIAVARDDVNQCHWFGLDELKEEGIEQEHRPLFRALVAWATNNEG